MHDRLAGGGASAANELPTTAGTRVSLRDVRRVFPNGVVALGGVSLDVAPGEFVAVLGPSGSGKSTLLRLVAGLDAPQGGTVAVERAAAAEHAAQLARPTTDVLPRTLSPEGGRLQDETLHHRIAGRAGVAYVFQDAHLLPWRDVLRNVALPLELAGVPKARRLERAREAIDLVGLADAAERYPAQLSGGMRMRASLARALVTEPSLFLLDEPFAALDEITRHRLDEQLRDLWARRRMTVLFVTHSINEAVFLAQRAVVLSRRPARVLLDQVIDLPGERNDELRTTAAFAREAHALYVALRGEEA